MSAISVRFIARLPLVTRIALVLFVGLSAIIGLARIIGQRQPPPDRIAMLHLSDCLPPCWIGITPGITTWAQARQIIQQTYAADPRFALSLDLSRNASMKIDLKNLANPLQRASIVLMATQISDDAPVRNVIFTFTTPDSIKLTLAELVSVLGTPSHTTLIDVNGSGAYAIAFNYKSADNRHISIVGRLVRSYIDWAYRPDVLEFFSAQRTTSAQNPNDRIWHGFTTLKRAGY